MLITDSYYTTKAADIVSEHERIFGVKVCGTCSSQLIKAYQNLITYQKNMAKKDTTENVEPKLKDEFKGSTYSNGKTSILLDSLTYEDAKKLFNESELKTYFE